MQLVLPQTWYQRWQGQDIFAKLFSLEGTVYRQQEGRRTVRFSLDGKHYFAKLHSGVGWKEILRNLLQFRLPVLGAQNEWQAIQRLEQLGIKTMRLVGYGKRGWNPARLQSFVITEEIPNAISLEHLSIECPEVLQNYSLKRNLITEVAKVARKLHNNGINHRDFYICHFLLGSDSGAHKPCDNDVTLYLIDLHRAQIRRRTPGRWRVKDIAGLYFSSMGIGLTKRDILRFVRIYWNRSLPEALRENRAFWRQVEKRAVFLRRKLYGKKPQLVWQ